MWDGSRNVSSAELQPIHHPCRNKAGVRQCPCVKKAEAVDQQLQGFFICMVTAGVIQNQTYPLFPGPQATNILGKSAGGYTVSIAVATLRPASSISCEVHRVQPTTRNSASQSNMVIRAPDRWKIQEFSLAKHQVPALPLESEAAWWRTEWISPNIPTVCAQFRVHLQSSPQTL